MARLTKEQMLAARPTRTVETEPLKHGDGSWRLRVPMRARSWASRILRLPADATRTFELDAIGKFVWDACDGKASVEQLIRRLASEYNLNTREAEVATIAFLNTLVQKRLIALAVDHEHDHEQ